MTSAAPRGWWRSLERLEGPAATLAVVIAVEALSSTAWWIPNPPSVLMLAIVFAVFRGGAVSGWISAAMAWTYCLYYFSTSVYPLTFTPANLRRVIVWGLVFPLMAAVVGRLRRRAELAARYIGEQKRLEAELSERRRAESALRESEELLRASSARFRVIADSAPVGIFETDARGGTLFVNRLWCELTGRSLEDAAGNRWLDAVHPEDRERVAAGWFRDPADRALRSTYRLVNPAGEVRWVDGHAVELRGEAGELTGYLGTLVDVTELRQAERDLQAQARYSAAVVDAVRQPLVVLDEELRIRSANASFHRLFGTQDGAIVGNLLLGLPGAVEMAGPLEQALRSALGGDRAIDDLDVAWSIPGVGRKDLVVSARRFRTAEAQERMILVAMEDVTESRTLKREIESTRRLETVGKFAGGLAHDFNNLLTVILNSAEFLEPALAERESALTDLRRIRAAGRKAATLTHQLLAFSRRQVLTPRVVDINDVIRELRELLVRVLPESIETRFDLAADPGVVEVDPAQIEQVLLNLVVNARDAMPEGGTLEIATRGPAPVPAGVPARAEPLAGDGVLVVVTDSGAGMDSETLERCFEPYFSTKNASESSGLGLATAYGIVRQSGGAIWAESEPDSGARLNVFLPRASPQLVSTAPKRAEEASGGKESILLVEDDGSVRAMISRMLRSLGYTVHEAPTPTAALELARGGEPFDLLVTDVVMGEMTGTRLAAELPELPALFVSGYASELVKREASSRIHFLQKPFSVAALSAAVRRALEEG